MVNNNDSPILEQSSHLKMLMTVVERLVDTHALVFQSVAEFYQRVMAGPSVVQFPLTGSYWRAGMPKDKVISYAPALTQVAALQSTVMMAGALDYYLYKMCQVPYQKMDLIDRTWFNLEMVNTLTGVDLDQCLKYPQITELFAVWHKFVKAEDYDLNPLLMTGRASVQDFADAVRIFSLDFERAFVIAHPKVRLP